MSERPKSSPVDYELGQTFRDLRKVLRDSIERQYPERADIDRVAADVVRRLGGREQPLVLHQAREDGGRCACVVVVRIDDDGSASFSIQATRPTDGALWSVWVGDSAELKLRLDDAETASVLAPYARREMLASLGAR